MTELRDTSAMQHVGLAARGREAVLADVLAAWDDFLDVAGQADMDARSRLKGWRAREICVHLGVWPGYRAMDSLLASARDDGSVQIPDIDRSNAQIIAQHRSASHADVMAALRQHRDDVAAFADQDPGLDLAPTASVAGRLPLLTVLMGECYELAVHALDLASTGAPQPSSRLLQLGISSLTDVTGALAASAGILGGVTLQTPDGAWTMTASADGWDTACRSGAAKVNGPTVSGPGSALLDSSSGRANPVVQLATRRLAVHDLPGLLRLVPLLSVAPNIPGGAMLALAARTLSGASSFLGRRWS